jgi:hypothetical protein
MARSYEAMRRMHADAKLFYAKLCYAELPILSYDAEKRRSE